MRRFTPAWQENPRPGSGECMIRSMTGFGRAEEQDTSNKVTVEIKSVNHRYLDLNIRMPRRFNLFESAVRGIMKEYVERGKIDVYISWEDFSESRSVLKYNKALAEQYMHYYRRMQDDFGLTGNISAAQLSSAPDVLTTEDIQPDEDALFSLLEKTVRRACENFTETRSAEGAHLRDDLLEKLDRMSADVEIIVQRGPEIVENYTQKIRQKVEELLADTQIEESRLITETVLFADKICTDEETVRLTSHIDAMKKALTSGDAVGRKLDFIAQEMNREANTILSKANDLITSDLAIELKTGIEKIREQIQNVE